MNYLHYYCEVDVNVGEARDLHQQSYNYREQIDLSICALRCKIR